MGHDQLIVLDGSTFFVTDRTGDCLPTQESGFFFQDIRHLSTWRLLADRAALRLLTSRNTGYQALPFHPELAQTTLSALAGLQATDRDDFRDADPGKIVHELRRGELAALGEPPQPLLRHPRRDPAVPDPAGRVRTLERRSRPGRQAGAGRPRGARLDRRAGRPRRRRLAGVPDPLPKGLRNQCWKDSWNSIRFADGRLAEPPIATCELQGYAYDARRRAARLARLVWDDAALADRLEDDAAALRERFDRDFWSEERGHYVLALDKDKRQVDAMTSNVGQLLWSGIVAERRAAAVADRLMAADMYSGWGVRTMSSGDAAYTRSSITTAPSGRTTPR